MDIIETINKRRSIRSFKPDPVPQDVLRKIVEAALRSPSASNSQPWEIAVAGGTKLAAIKQACLENAKNKPCLDVPIPWKYPEPWSSRQAAVMAGILEKLGIAREDKQKRFEFGLEAHRLWGAPSCIYIMIERSFYLADGTTNVWNLFDCGLITQNILLLATSYGLGSIPAIQTVFYPDIIRKILDIPDSKLIILGIPIGYIDSGNSVNQLQTSREKLEKVARFYE
ncbi:MAG: NADH dehydrogenase [Smithella sp. PtaU1.Bin162]|nr:MAG: NADH dehydrogenase [Smithella sp. PtaU1.Bin162]